MSKESPMSASIANALIEKSVRKMQSTSSMVYGTMSDPGSARPHVIRSPSSVSDVKTACERRKRKRCRKALVKYDELVMLKTIEKPRHQPYANTIMLDLVDRSDEVVLTIDRVVKDRIVYRVPKDQRDGATIREGQHTSTEIAEGELVNAACVASVRSTGKVMELREDKSSLVPYQARSRTREVWILQRLRGMSCVSVGRRGVETSWQGVPTAHQSGYDVRRRGPAKTAYGGGATRASSIGRKS